MASKARRQQRLISVVTGVALTASFTTNGTNKNNTVSVPECKVGDLVTITLANPTDGVVVDGYVSANGTVTVRILNCLAGNLSFTGTATVQCTRLF